MLSRENFIASLALFGFRSAYTNIKNNYNLLFKKSSVFIQLTECQNCYFFLLKN